MGDGAGSSADVAGTMASHLLGFSRLRKPDAFAVINCDEANAGSATGNATALQPLSIHNNDGG
ncbi:hypothetical protein DXM27_09210 [Rhizobium rhizogenes]|uniref:Uncharacterized protein n=1 Tax=Rhizobium rhizogenes TaxID=359 RepID=A0AA88F5J0_RHIRH|nr:hypothetical protein DXM27_09210 [Rhizobium rhizogenes]